MSRFIYIAATFAIAVFPSMAVAECGEGNCAVGTNGQGGARSGGKARGGLLEQPSSFFPNATLRSAGTENTGLLSVTGQESASGAIHGDTFSGHATGIFGDFSGQCDLVDFENGDC
jgi:hypothetical protein